jgi:hypothetical protein
LQPETSPASDILAGWSPPNCVRDFVALFGSFLHPT